MVHVKANPPKYLICFAGQSLNEAPAAPNDYPTVLMTSLTKTLRYDVHKFGIAWAQFAAIRARYVDIQRMAGAAQVASVLIMVGGTTDIAVGATGSATYTREKEYSDIWKTAGGSVAKVIGTTTTPSTTFTAGQNTQLADLNSRVNADASDAFDQVVDLAADSLLDDAADTTYYSDGTHWTAAGASRAAALILPAVQALGLS